jgi:hypothetical protein
LKSFIRDIETQFCEINFEQERELFQQKLANQVLLFSLLYLFARGFM